MTDKLTGISVFVEAVDAEGFSNAAQRLNLSRSAVGKTIARLEQRLGVRLFQRTTRSQMLTEDGQLFYERCLRALEEIRAAEIVLESGKQDAAGRLRVTMPVLFGRRCVAPVLTELARKHPHLELDLSLSDRPADLIEDGYDLAIRNGPLPDSTGMVGRRIANQRMTVCAAPSYLERAGEPMSLDTIADHEAITYGRAGRIRSWLFPTGKSSPLEITPKSRVRFDDLEAIADAAVAGMGLAWLPCWLIRERVQRGELKRVLTTQPGIVFPVHALWPQSPHMPLRMRLAIEALAASLPQAME